MKSILMTIAALLVASAASAHGQGECEHILRSPRIFKAEEVKLPTPPMEGVLEQAISSLSALKMNGLGTRWLEERYSKRRSELLDAVSSGSFKKLVLAKPQLAELVVAWAGALERLPEIDKGFESLSEVEKKAFVGAYDAIRAALISHALSWTKVSSRELEFPRILLILNEIKDFDAAKPKYSLYRIKRAIETRHSLREYAECR